MTVLIKIVSIVYPFNILFSDYFEHLGAEIFIVKFSKWDFLHKSTYIQHMFCARDTKKDFLKKFLKKCLTNKNESGRIIKLSRNKAAIET
jgi:hypothetical protein